jgi:hypothetical protein
MAEPPLSNNVSVTSTTTPTEADAMKKLLATTIAGLALYAVTVGSNPTATSATHWSGWPCDSYHGACHGPVRPL